MAIFVRKFNISNLHKSMVTSTKVSYSTKRSKNVEFWCIKLRPWTRLCTVCTSGKALFSVLANLSLSQVSFWGRAICIYIPGADPLKFCTFIVRSLNGFEKCPNSAENRIKYVLLTTWDANSIFSSANQARPGSQKLPLNCFAKWNFVRYKEKAYQNRE